MDIYKVLAPPGPTGPPPLAPAPRLTVLVTYHGRKNLKLKRKLNFRKNIKISAYSYVGQEVKRAKNKYKKISTKSTVKYRKVPLSTEKYG